MLLCVFFFLFGSEHGTCGSRGNFIHSSSTWSGSHYGSKLHDVFTPGCLRGAESKKGAIFVPVLRVRSKESDIVLQFD